VIGKFRSAAGPAPGTPVDLRAIGPGTHLIALYQGEAELTRAATAFVSAGLASGDRVLYVASDRPLPAARASLVASDAAAGSAITAGQLVLRSLTDVYGETGDLAAAATALRTIAGLARAAGYPGLRVAIEMGDFVRVLGSIEQVLVWERMATRLQHEEGISSVCQYDQQRLGGERSGFLASEHAGAAPLAASPPQASFLATPQGLRITGELDITNREGFIRVVDARLAVIGQLVLDVGELAFMDAGTLAELHLVAAGLPRGGRITLAGAAPQLRRLAGVLEWRHPQLTIEPAAR
jgi:anti-anti-sigma regulatory factor